MSEQWFLDLDGMRSGPYHTSEVMSLIAEGEVLPHHQISSELKSPTWNTILEWRLQQNRNLEAKKPSIVSPSPISALPPSSPVSASPISSISSPTTPPPNDPVIRITPESEPPPSPVPVIPTFSPSVESEKKPAPPTLPSTPPSSSKPKRDPMAEMFDMLQSTKQKREIKSQQASARASSSPSIPPSPATPLSKPVAGFPEVQKPKGRNSWVKTISYALLITILGFALGQVFQRQWRQTPSTDATALPSPSGTNTPSDTPPSGETIETRDRSTEKMTIRAQVPTTPVPAPSAPPSEHMRDLPELRDLRNELQELKALKENRGHFEERPSGGEMPPQDYPANPYMDPNGMPPNMDGGVQPGESPRPGETDEEVHY